MYGIYVTCACHVCRTRSIVSWYRTKSIDSTDITFCKKIKGYVYNCKEYKKLNTLKRKTSRIGINRFWFARSALWVKCVISVVSIDIEKSSCALSLVVTNNGTELSYEIESYE